MTTLEYDSVPEDARRDYDPSPPPRHLLARHRARVLDPERAERVAGAVPRGTVYVSDRLICPAAKTSTRLLMKDTITITTVSFLRCSCNHLLRYQPTG